MLHAGVWQHPRYLLATVLCLGLASLLIASPSGGAGQVAAIAAPAADSVASKDGVNIVFTAAGEGQTALVFIHGWACNRSFWKAQVEHFSPKYKVVALDLAGHGESAGGREAYTIEAFGDDVAAVVEKLNLNRVILIGHSMGGQVSIAAARDLGDKVIGIVGADTLQDFTETRTPDQVERALKPFKDDFKGTTRAFATAVFGDKAAPALVQSVCSQMCSIQPAVGLSALRSEALYNVKSELVGFKLPLRVINSDKYPTNVAGNKEIYRNFAMVPMPGVGHFVMLEDPARFNQLLEGVIAELVAKRPM